MKAYFKSFVALVVAAIVLVCSIFLNYTAYAYPCLRGAGLAMADFEAAICLIFLGIPCVIWAIYNLRRGRNISSAYSWDQILIIFVARMAIVLLAIYAMLSIPVIFSFEIHPLRFFCSLA